MVAAPVEVVLVEVRGETADLTVEAFCVNLLGKQGAELGNAGILPLPAATWLALLSLEVYMCSS